VRTLLRHGSLAAAADLAQAHGLPASLARVRLAAGDGPAAIAVLEPWHAEARDRDWRDRVLEATTLRALAHQATGETALALHHLEEALVMAEPDGHVRLFVDEGPPMARLLGEARARGILPASTGRLLAALAADERAQDRPADLAAPLAGALSQRELEVTRLIAQGLSNREIAERLYLALDTVKGHNRRIFNKLGVQRRSEVIARARELGLAEP
jgi:LuxR family maltose regulon positive regulatory protein